MPTADKTAIKRATLAAHKAIEDLDADALESLREAYTKVADEITQQISAHAGTDDRLALTEMRSLLGEIERRLRQLSDERDRLLDAALRQAAQEGVAVFDAAPRLADEAFRFVHSFIAADGLQLSDRIWRLDRGARDAVINAVEQAVIQGHGASQAAREFLARGLPVPEDVQEKLGAANAARVGNTVRERLLTGQGTPLYNALRLFRTEINRAHGEAYMAAGAGHPDFAGWRFLLSPAHPKPDICDLLARQNLYGLGPGVYPNREKCPWPAHPNTLSFLEIVFKDEISAGDQAGKETPTEALAKLTPAQREGALGKAKAEVFDDGRLRQGMIRAPWRAVRERLGGDFVPAYERARRLPGADEAQIDERKVLGYALNPDHPVGGNKARRFKAALGYDQSNAGELLAAIRAALPTARARRGVQDKHGQRYSVDLALTGPSGAAVVRTGWIVEAQGTAPRLTSLYVHRS